jgi:hypothetical protein
MSYCYASTTFDVDGKQVSDSQTVKFNLSEFVVETYKQWMYLFVKSTLDGLVTKVSTEEFPDLETGPSIQQRWFGGFRLFGYRSPFCNGSCVIVQNPDQSWWFTSGYYCAETDEYPYEESKKLDLFTDLITSEFFDRMTEIPEEIRTKFRKLVEQHIEKERV